MKRKYFIKRMLWHYCIVAIPILLLSALMYLVLIQNMRSTINDKAQAQLSVSKNNLELAMDVSGQLSVLIDNTPALRATIASLLYRDRLDYGGLITYNFLIYMLGYPTRVNPQISSVYLYITNQFDNFISSDGRMSPIHDAIDYNWHQSYLQNLNRNTMWVEQRLIQRSAFDPNLHSVISVFHPIFNGVIVVNINQWLFNQLLIDNQNYQDELIFVTTGDYQLLFYNQDTFPDWELLATLSEDNMVIRIDDQLYIVNKQHSERFQIIFWSLIPNDVLFEGTNTLLRVTFILLLVSLIFTFISSYVSTHRNFRRLSNIIDLFHKAEKGLPIDDLQEENDEYALLLNNVIRTFVIHSHVKLQLSQRQYKLQAAELMALQLQMNPHFLFNTLQTIDFEIVNHCGEMTTSNYILQHLSDLLKYALDGSTPATIQDEIGQIKKYCEIQKFRYPDKFFLVWDYPDNIGQYQILRLILQPLIENSLYHGIKPKEGKSLIKVQIIDAKERIMIRVVDNGVGIDKIKLAEMKQRLALDEDMDKFNHIGIVNTNRRLVLSYGDDSRLQIRSKINRGTIVSFAIPKFC